MTRDFDARQYQEKVHGMVLERLSVPTGKLDLGGLMGEVVAAAEGELAKHPLEDIKLACRAGCGSCCMLNVAVLFPEVVAIVDYVLKSWPPERLRTLIRRLDQLYRRVAGLDDEARLALREHCAFLDEEGLCSIYPVRPLICRSVTSTDAERCREALLEPWPGAARPVFMYLTQKHLMEAAFIGLGNALEETWFDARSGQLTVGVQHLLENPGLKEHFLAKRPVWDEMPGGFSVF